MTEQDAKEVQCILKKFYANALTQSLKTIFRSGGYIYATDGVICCRHKIPAYCEEWLYSEQPVDIEKALPWHDVSITLTEPLAAMDFEYIIKPCPHCTASGQESFTMPCIECNGAKEIVFNNEHSAYSVTCKSCQGSGVQLVEPDVDICYTCRNHKILPDKKQISGVTYDGRYLKLIQDNIPGVRIGIYKNADFYLNKPPMLVFKSEHFEGFLMPRTDEP